MQRKIMASVTYSADGEWVTIHYTDGSEETRHTDDMHDLYFCDAISGEIVQWGNDGAYQTPAGFVAL